MLHTSSRAGVARLAAFILAAAALLAPFAGRAYDGPV